MKQTTINFEEALTSQHPIDVKASIREAMQVINQTLDSRSEFYSRMLGQSVTWRKALRIGVVLPMLLGAVAICGMQAPLITMISIASASWLVYRLQEEKGGEV